MKSAVRRRFDFTGANLAQTKLDAFRPFQLQAFKAQAGISNPIEAKKAYEDTLSSPEASKARKEYQEAQRKYVETEAIVTGIRNVRRDLKNPNKIVLDTRPVHFSMGIFASPDARPELQEISSNSSSTMILETADGKAILQYRHLKNVGWPHTPAASASGYMDDIPFRQKKDADGNVVASNERRKLRPLNTKDIKDNALRELNEELGIKAVDSNGNVLIEDEDISIAALVHERTPVHDEFLIMAKTKLTAEEVIAQSEHSIKNEKLPNPADFREKYYVIDSDPETIFKLITQSRCPLPTAHSAAWITKGYQKMLERGNISEAERWKKLAEVKVAKNYDAIDRLSTEGKYSSRITPEENGVPTFDSEMRRLGIIS